MEKGGEEEIKNLIKIWSMAISSACYAYSLTRLFRVPPGFFRFLLILPVIFLFTLLPFSLSSFHLGGPTFFYLVWLSNFKLLLYSFHSGPLPSLPSLSHFIFVALFPIKLLHNYNYNYNYHTNKLLLLLLLLLLFGVVKLLAFVFVIKLYDFIHHYHLPSFVLFFNYCCHLYLGIEIALAVTAFLIRPILGTGSVLGLAPQFNEPYLSTSLQDFWGRRWNLMVSDILRLSVYDPIRRVASSLVGKRWASFAGMIASFTVSGLMHELIYYYFTRVSPTWEVTWFFVLHGVCTALEVVVKRAAHGRLRLHRLISGGLTIGFLGMTAWWLFLPQIIRNGVDVKVIQEYPLMFAFVNHKLSSLFNWISSIWLL